MTLESLFSEGRLIGNLSYVLLIVSMAMRDMFWLRILAICSGLAGAGYAYVWLHDPVGTFWELSFTGVNIVQWSLLMYERRLRHLTPEEQRIKDEVFPLLSIFDFRKLLKEAEPMTFLKGDSLLSRQAEVTFIFLILRGEAAVSIDGKVISSCTAYDFVGEIGFLNKVPASADVNALTTLECLVFDTETLRRRMRKSREFERGLTESLSANLAAKLIRRNEVGMTA